MEQQVLSHYKKFRYAGHPAQAALRAAKTQAAFVELEEQGWARLVSKADDWANVAEVYGEGFELLSFRTQQNFREDIEKEGVWGICTELYDPLKEEWWPLDSCWGYFFPYKNHEDPLVNFAVIDHMAIALLAFNVLAQLSLSQLLLTRTDQ